MLVFAEPAWVAFMETEIWDSKKSGWETIGRVTLAGAGTRVTVAFCKEEGKLRLPLGRDSWNTPCNRTLTLLVLFDESQILNVSVPAIVAEGGGSSMGWYAKTIGRPTKVRL